MTDEERRRLRLAELAEARAEREALYHQPPPAEPIALPALGYASELEPTPADPSRFQLSPATIELGRRRAAELAERLRARAAAKRSAGVPAGASHRQPELAGIGEPGPAGTDTPPEPAQRPAAAAELADHRCSQVAAMFSADSQVTNRPDHQDAHV